VHSLIPIACQSLDSTSLAVTKMHHSLTIQSGRDICPGILVKTYKFIQVIQVIYKFIWTVSATTKQTHAYAGMYVRSSLLAMILVCMPGEHLLPGREAFYVLDIVLTICYNMY
jgi:hypothetical protein